MILKLLPVEVESSEITSPTSSIITPAVICSFTQCGGDYNEAVPWCLLKARASFRAEALTNPADFDENMSRSTACEVLARRIVHNLGLEDLEGVMSTRYRWVDRDGDTSPPASAIEIAIDQHATIFLSSSEAQHVVQHLWRGDWVQVYGENDHVDWVPYKRQEGFTLDPHRLAVPRYQTAFNVFVWLFFLFVYSQAVQTPVDKQNHVSLDVWEVLLYGMAGSFLLGTITKTWKEFQLTSRALSILSFWTVVDYLVDAILLAAFILRMVSMYHPQHDVASALHLKGFQVLSTAAPLIWMKLLTVFDGVKIIGVLQIVVFRMLRDSAIFFILLGIMALGFAQSLYALDAADGSVGSTEVITNGLLQALLGSPDFDTPNQRFGYPFGLIIYYAWSALTIVILLNVLIALFGTSYSNVEENSTDEFLAWFAYKTVKLIRSPDTYVFPPPFNLIEVVLLLPLEWVCSARVYDRLNIWVMRVVFCVPLTLIALWESRHAGDRLERYLGTAGQEEEDTRWEDPEVDEGQIAKVKFDELVKAFPK